MNELQTFANGDTNYIAKHNSNYSNIHAAVSALEANMAAQVAAASGPGSAFTALFGPTGSIVGSGSYASTGSGDTLTVAAGFAWKPSIPMVVQNATNATILFTGLAAGTYYISADNTGAPVRNASSGPEDLYSVVWTGTAFGAITRLAPVVWGPADETAALNSTALAQTYLTLDARLEAGEAAATAGALARTWQTGRLSKDVSGGADVTLTNVEANNTLLNLTGTLTANINVIVPLGVAPRLWVVTNNTTGAFTVTVKGSTGTGTAVSQGGEALLSQDGANVFAAGGGGPGTVKSVNTKTPDGSGAVTLAASDIGAVAASALGAANGAATLDSGGKLPASQLPNLAIIDFLGTVANQAAMLALSGQKGDWCARTDTSTVYVITGSDPTQIGSWTSLSYPTGSGGTVTSVGLTTPGLLFDVSGSPVVGAGTLGMTLKTQVKNTFLAGPTTGADAAPTMRALVAADLPVMGASGTNHAPGAVPDPGATAGTTKFLCENGSWSVPAGGGSTGGFGGGEAAFYAPAVGNFTQTNFGTTGTATVAENFTAPDGTAGVRLRERGDGLNNNHLRSLLKTAPGGSTWTMLARLRSNTLLTNWQALGITLTDSVSGKYIFYGWAYDAGPFSYITWAGANTYTSASLVCNPSGGVPFDAWFGFYYDGTNLNFLYSRDGNYFVTLKRTGLTDYLANAPSAGGICINPNCSGNNTQQTVLECLSFYYAVGAPPVPYS